MSRGLKLFVSLDAGITRGTDGGLAWAPAELEQASAGGRPAGLRARDVTWIFGSQRTGSTWLSAMMAEPRGHAVWREPLVGMLFGNFYARTAEGHAEKKARHYIFANDRRPDWLASIERFVLSEASSRFPEAETLVVQEPNGSEGAPLLMEAMPESAMVLLVRDPRDAVSSSLAAHRKSGWLYEWSDEARCNRWGRAPDENPDGFVRGRAQFYAKSVGRAREAYAAHRGRKALVRYEDLRTDTLATLQRMYSSLDREVDHVGLAGAVDRNSWERIPEERKGESRFYRKATPGGWREDLTPGQIEIVENVTAPLLEEFYAV